MFAPYTFDDPRLADEREQQRCEHGVFTKERCTTMTPRECRECKSPTCVEHLEFGLCVECRLDRDMEVVAA